MRKQNASRRTCAGVVLLLHLEREILSDRKAALLSLNEPQQQIHGNYTGCSLANESVYVDLTQHTLGPLY